MSLSKEAKRIYQRNYMRHKRSNKPDALPYEGLTGGSNGLSNLSGLTSHAKPVPYPANPTLKQSREWEEYRTKLRKG